ncbi:2-iminoacetate synthase ThiH [Deferribacter thermophilus]|uniref:2-iminoacetate synthase ThiH n=1 Tax=Deferribacter thermophilus TaxID=53573 RepID=UPI003C144A38
MSFYDIYKEYSWEEIKDFIYTRRENDVIDILFKENLSVEDFATLLSPAAEKFLEDMAQKAHKITVMRFGKTIKLYAPLYLSNVCQNACTYCGFNVFHKIPRITLKKDEIEREAKAVADTGIKHILLLTGEAPNVATLEYLKGAVSICNKYFSSIGIEIYPLDINGYKELIDVGVDYLTIYQETYNRETYDKIHPKGKKKDFLWRLETPERGAIAGMRTVGIGALMGLEDFRVDEFFVGLHAKYLMKKYWKTHITVSFPRMRKAPGVKTPFVEISDKNLVQSMLAMRLFLHDVGIVISTREPANLRDNLIPLGVTQMSAGSKTEPGGYTLKEDENAEQFHIEDNRTVDEIINVIRSKGYDPVLKDWDRAFVIS